MTLLDRLKAASKRQGGAKWDRFLQQPWRIGGPYLLRLVGTGYHARATTFFGRTMQVWLPEPVSVTIWRYGFFEADVATYLIAALRPGGVFIDIGGHFGFFSMLGRELVGRAGTVVTFEPMLATREILNENMLRNAAECRHLLIPAAAGAEDGTLIFKDFGLRGSAFATSFKERNSDLKEVGSVRVNVRTVDDVVRQLRPERLDLIKIDAENSEEQVVQGATATIDQFRPAIILETGDMGGSTTRPILDGLFAKGYRAFEFDSFNVISHSALDSYSYKNLLLVHYDRVNEIDALPKADRAGLVGNCNSHP